MCCTDGDEHGLSARLLQLAAPPAGRPREVPESSQAVEPPWLDGPGSSADVLRNWYCRVDVPVGQGVPCKPLQSAQAGSSACPIK